MPLFQSTRSIVDWLQAQGFTALTLLSSTPKKSADDVITIEIGVPDFEHEDEGRLLVWRFTASGVVRWTTTTLLSNEALTLERIDDNDNDDDVDDDVGGAPIALRFVAGGQATLACAAIDVVDAGTRLRAARPQHWQDGFRMCCPEELRLGELLDAIAVPNTTLTTWRKPITAEPGWTLRELAAAGGPFCLFERACEIIAIMPINEPPHVVLSVSREPGCSDEEWDRVWALPTTFAVGDVTSHDLVTTPARWADIAWRDGKQR